MNFATIAMRETRAMAFPVTMPLMIPALDKDDPSKFKK